MKILKTKLKGVYLIKNNVFKDFRGKYFEIYNEKNFFKKKIRIKFIQDDISMSKKNVLRGIHGDKKTWKLITCIEGKFKLLVVNNDKKSRQFKKWQMFTLSENNNHQVLVPPKFGNAHFVLSKRAIFHYKQNTMYDRKSQFTIKWNDPSYKFNWPKTGKKIISKRDK